MTATERAINVRTIWSKKHVLFFMKASHRPIPSDRTMVLLEEVVEIVDLTNYDRNILAGTFR